MTRRPRIAIAGFQHETNTFAPFGATYQDFVQADGWPALTIGEAMLPLFRPVNIPIGGFIVAADEFDLVPIVWASAEPCSYVSDDAFDRIAGMICDGVAGAGRLDGIYLDLHGAMVTASHEDGEGELLSRLRRLVGADLPIVASLDMHANVTRAMVELSDALAIYRTYPHVDMIETGARASRLLRHRLARGRPLHKAFRKLPFLIPLSAQCTGVEPSRGLYAGIPELEAAGVLGLDLASGFAAADIFDCGPAVVAYGSDEAATERAADRLYAEVISVEDAFENPLVPVQAAVSRAKQLGRPGRPVILADTQDNPGGGGTSDTTGLLRALVEQGARDACLGLLWDPAAAAAAHEAGVGAERQLTLGGRFGYDPEPFTVRCVVEALSGGTFPCSGTIFGGVTVSLGPMARLRILATDSEVRVVVCSTRFQCLDQALFREVGIEPRDQAILALKSTIHFRADFEPIAGEILMVDSPGANLCHTEGIAYRNLRPGVRLAPGRTA
jgi:microcystin degradation protein MlrC